MLNKVQLFKDVMVILLIVWVIIALLSIAASGCALINTAVSAGIAYGLYELTKD